MTSIMEALDDQHYPMFPKAWPDEANNFDDLQILYGLKDEDHLISLYKGTCVLVKTLQIPKQILESIMQSNEDQKGFLIKVKNREIKNPDIGLPLLFGGNPSKVECNGEDLGYGQAENVVRKSITTGGSSKTKLSKKMSEFKEKYLNNKTTFESQRVLKFQLNHAESSKIEIINFQWVKEDIHGKKRQQSRDSHNLCKNGGTINGDLKIDGDCDVKKHLTCESYSARGGDICEMRKLCPDTLKLRDEIGSLKGCVVQLCMFEDELVYSIIAPTVIPNGAQVSVITTRPGLKLAESRHNDETSDYVVNPGGEVPVKYTGTVKKGDNLVPSGNNDGMAKVFSTDGDIKNSYFAIALEDPDEATKTIMARIMGRAKYDIPRYKGCVESDKDFFNYIVQEKLKVEKKNQNYFFGLCEKLKSYDVRRYKCKIRRLVKSLQNVGEGKCARFGKEINMLIKDAHAKAYLKPLGKEVNYRLRKYQEELVANTLDRKRAIIVLPTGGGKTFVAGELIYQKMKHMKGNISIFLCPTVILQQQQENFLLSYINFCNNKSESEIEVRKNFYTHSSNEFSLRSGKNEIFVMTTGGFNNVNLDEELLSRIDYIVFDEIHHAECKGKKSTYNKILNKIDMLESETCQCAIIGLTATPAAAKTMSGTSEKFDSLLHLLSAEKDDLILVVDNKKELKKWCQEKEFSEKIVKRRKSDQMCIKKVKDKMFDLEDSLSKGMQRYINLPIEKNTYKYQVNTSILAQEVILHYNENGTLYRNKLVFLSYLSEALCIIDDLGYEFALEYVLKPGEMSILKDSSNECDRFCGDIRDFLNDFESKTLNLKSENNSKYMETKQTILDFVEKTENDDCRIIVFVKSRLVAKRLAFKINNDTDFKNQNLESDYLLGHTGKSLPGRPYGLEMSREKQKEIVEAFKLGSISILVATPIAEE
eukprot:g3588.t1